MMKERENNFNNPHVIRQFFPAKNIWIRQKNVIQDPKRPHIIIQIYDTPTFYITKLFKTSSILWTPKRFTLSFFYYFKNINFFVVCAKLEKSN